MSDELVRAVSDVGPELEADRCWLYVRDPERRRGIAAVRWLRTPTTPDLPVQLHDWAAEAPDLHLIDPLFARALAGEPLDAIADAATGPCNAELERALGHRAFMHLNVQIDGVLWGTLQPGMTAAARTWSKRERARLLARRAEIAPLMRAAAADPALRSLLVIVADRSSRPGSPCQPQSER